MKKKKKRKKITIMIIINLVPKMIWATANCIARKALYCDIVALDVQEGGLYCKRRGVQWFKCIAIEVAGC